MKDDGRSLLIGLENALDLIINLAAFISAYIVIVPILAPVWQISPISLASTKTQLLLFISTVLCSLFYQFFNCYRPIPYINAIYSVSHLVFANSTYFSLSAIFTLIATSGERSHFLLVWILASYITSTAFMIFKKRVIIFFVRWARKQRNLVKKVIVVGDNAETADAFIKEVIKDKHNGIMILGAVGNLDADRVGCDRLGDFSELADIIKKQRPDYAIFAVDSYDKDRLIELVNLCDEMCVKIYFLPVIFGFFKTPRQVERVGNIPIINVHSTPLDNRFNAFAKRTIDIIGALALIILTSPIMLVSYIGVKISSPGPAIFKQTRVGVMGKKFKMLKFRSMRMNSDSRTAWTTDTDARKTKFGTFIRKTAIDELPQLFNVLRGEMSLVGPRPEIPHFVDDFKRNIPLYMVKHYVKPGMTGLAQVKGLRGDTSVWDRVNADIIYIENWSLMLDLSILLKTPFKAFNKNEKYVEPEFEDDADEE